MKLPTHIDTYPTRSGRERVSLTALLLAAALTLSACATLRPVTVSLPALQNSEAVVQIPDVDVLAVSPAMEEFLDQYVVSYRNLDTRLDLLTLAVVENGVLGFDYNDARTSTAEQTFSSRSGNCISHANMLIALARRAGLDAHYQEVVIQPEWSSRENTLLISKHVNVVVTSPRNSFQVDVSGTEASRHTRRKILSDRDAKAMYFNNLGAAALIENDLATAYAFMVKAIDTAPQVADSWINLGVVFSRNQQFAEAEMSLKTALQIDPYEYSAMNNLYAIYVTQEKLDAAKKWKKRVENYRRKNPYYLLMLSEKALEQSQFEESTKLLKRAIRKKENDHRLHFALAKTQFLAGNKTAADSSLLRARELAPKGLDYTLPPDQLIDKD